MAGLFDSTSGNRSCVASTRASMPSPCTVEKEGNILVDSPAGLPSTTHRLHRGLEFKSKDQERRSRAKIKSEDQERRSRAERAIAWAKLLL
jgi:hypothetical protein